ncbi:MAG: hypothetical protein KC502_14905 [Myxococcales bacterium]|nr:hypothetical protein [Myxococcales bacterium]
MRSLAATAAAASLMLGCSGPDYDPPTLVKSLRVLALRADPPFVSMSPTKATPFVVGQRAGSKLCYAWALCPFAWQEEGNYQCLDPSIQVDLGTGPTATFSLVQLFSVLDKLPAVLEKKGLNLPSDVVVDGATDGETDKPDVQLEGSNLEVKLLYQVSEARIWGGTCPDSATTILSKPCKTRDGCMFGYKQLGVVMPANLGGKPGADPQQAPKGVHSNPILQTLALNGVPWPADVTPTVAPYKADTSQEFPSQDETRGLELLPIWPEDSVELIAKSKEAGVPDRKERLIFSFYSDAGSFQYRRTGYQVPHNGFQADKPAESAKSQLVNLWVVLRDGRGGVDWAARKVMVHADADPQLHPLCGPDPTLPKCDEAKP